MTTEPDPTVPPSDVALAPGELPEVWREQPYPDDAAPPSQNADPNPGQEVTCSRCGRTWPITPEDQLHDTAEPLHWDGDVDEQCLLDLLDLSMGRPARSGRSLPATNQTDDQEPTT